MNDRLLFNTEGSLAHKISMTTTLSIHVPTELYLRNPEETELGRKIVSHSIPLLLELGFDKFTFKKLGERIGSPEASIYRYFSSKHQLLHYLNAWYWNWLRYLLKTRTANVTDPKRRLKMAISVLLDASKMDLSIPHIDEAKLHKVIVREGTKAELDDDSRRALAAATQDGHAAFCEEFAELIRAYKRGYRAPKALVAMMIAAAHELVHIGENFPRRLEIKGSGAKHDEFLTFLEDTLFRVLNG